MHLGQKKTNSLFPISWTKKFNLVGRIKINFILTFYFLSFLLSPGRCLKKFADSSHAYPITSRPKFLHKSQLETIFSNKTWRFTLNSKKITSKNRWHKSQGPPFWSHRKWRLNKNVLRPKFTDIFCCKNRINICWVGGIFLLGRDIGNKHFFFGLMLNIFVCSVSSPTHLPSLLRQRSQRKSWQSMKCQQRSSSTWSAS